MGNIVAVTASSAGPRSAAPLRMQLLRAVVLHKADSQEALPFHVVRARGQPPNVVRGARFPSGVAPANIYEFLGARDRTAPLEFGAAGLTIALAILMWQVRRVRQSRQAAEKANSAKSHFLANISHEIRTPLNGIVAAAELLARSGLTAEQREMTALILGSAETLIALVNDVLDLSKIESGEIQIEHLPLNIRSAVQDVIRLYTPRAQEKGLRLSFGLDPDVPEQVLGDALRIRQVLIHLLSNAIKFTKTGGISLEVACAGSGNGAALLFRVIDTGIGIAPEISRNLFSAFTQAESTAARKFGGAGLGLAISLRLVSLMGGSIGLESEPGRGSVFWFIVPARAVETLAAAPQRAEEPAARDVAVHILVVDDNPVNQVVAARALRCLGYAPEIVASGEGALEALAKRPYDLILMDCQMPGLDGYQTSAEIRRREAGRRPVPIVAMTANAIEGDRERCAAAGMDDYLAKPFRIAALQSVLDRWLPSPLRRSVA